MRKKAVKVENYKLDRSCEGGGKVADKVKGTRPAKVLEIRKERSSRGLVKENSAMR